jgi:O-antigen/teichoic acid export membrane protein
MFEHRKQPLAHPKTYAWRQLKYAGAALVFISFSLAFGTWGYMHYAGLRCVDAFLNASMILGGMGPVDPLPNDSAKWFASFYALFSGFALLTTVAVILTPLVHRFLHRLHLDEKDR